MARTPFVARIKPPMHGATTYTVPAGKFAVTNIFVKSQHSAFQGGIAGINLYTLPVTLTLNGVDVCLLSTAGSTNQFQSHRNGPFVFNAGDVIGNNTPNPPSGEPTDICDFGLNGFLYDLSTRKVPLNQKLVAGTTSYTVPAGKHVVANLFGSVYVGAKVFIDGVHFANVGLPIAIPDMPNGPFVVGAGSTLNLTNWQSHPLNYYGLLSGFLYNNT